WGTDGPTALMDWYRICKYDPAFRDGTGAYQRDEWTSVSDIGRTFDGVTLDASTYLATETAYVRAIREFMTDAGVTMLRVAALEPPPDLDPLVKYQLPDAEPLARLAHEIRDGMELSGTELDLACRLNLREVLWCRLEQPARLVVETSYDYYLHIGTAATSERAITKVHELGLFVHEAPDLARGRE
ncbi:MAG TPA: hypothetical protein VF486_02670, partial [Actinomycetes bacterium]